ncbi:hypothetical protein [Mycobacterium riyadhense]|uniref:hypothetical protein n=1 Tax=Mycobacterium riyadhense TaxID=486698 RepID=UPI00195E55C7|nr:hypothetical protein [Mycobacterium riyadhense]
MTPTGPGELKRHELDRIAWKFLGSRFAECLYADWPIDRRVDAYLLHHGLTNIMNDGTVYDALLESVMDNIGPALRKGVLAQP